MRLSVLSVSVVMTLAGCASSSGSSSIPYAKPNALIEQEIESRIRQIPYQHREELLQNLLWLAQQGEPAIPALLDGLEHQDPKVRSSSAWTLGRIHDRRTIPNLKAAARDPNETVRMEVARSLVLMGDLQQAPTLIRGLDSDRKEVRFLCHEALKTATGRDFGYDHLSEDVAARQQAVYGWRTWWADYSGDEFFAQEYAQQHGFADPEGQPAAPMGETQQPFEPTPQLPDNQPPANQDPDKQPQSPKEQGGGN